MDTNSTVQGQSDEALGVRSKAPVMDVKYPRCAGIDIAKSEHWVALPAHVDGEHRVRKFDGFTQDLQALSGWLRQHEIEQLAMEATGVYWIAPMNCWIGTASRCGWSIRCRLSVAISAKVMPWTVSGSSS